MAIFNSYVCLPEGNYSHSHVEFQHFDSMKQHGGSDFKVSLPPSCSWLFEYPRVIKHGNGKWTNSQWLFSSGIFQPAMFDETRGYILSIPQAECLSYLTLCRRRCAHLRHRPRRVWNVWESGNGHPQSAPPATSGVFSSRDQQPA